MADYDKAAVKEILMRRDSMSEEEADDLIEQTQDEIDELSLEEGTTLEDVEDAIKSNLGLEPDYLMDFLPM